MKISIWTGKRKWSFQTKQRRGAELSLQSRTGKRYTFDEDKGVLRAASGQQWRVTRVEGRTPSTSTTIKHNGPITPASIEDWSRLLDGLPPMSSAYPDAHYVADLLKLGLTPAMIWKAHTRKLITLSRVDMTDGLDHTKLARGVQPMPGVAQFDRVRKGAAHA